VIALLRRNRALLYLALGFSASQLGLQIGWIALVWWVLNAAHSPQLLGALFVAFQVPMILSAPLVGALLDRVDAKNVAIGCIAAATLAEAALAVFAWRGALPLSLLFALVVVVSLSAPATLTYRRVLIGRLVADGELPAAYAVFSMGSEAAILLGPAAGGVIVGKLSTAAALAALAIGTAAYLGAIAVSRYTHEPGPRKRKLDLLEGTREIMTRPLVLGVTLLTFFFFLAYGPLEVALPVAARSVFHTDATGYGIMWTAYAVGSVSGLLVLRARYERFPTVLVLCAIAIIWGALASGLAFAPTLVSAMLVLLVAGFFWSPYNALESAFMQMQVPTAVQGAVFSMQSSFLYTLAVPLGAMLGGWALAHTSPRTVMLASGVACIAAGVIGAVTLRRRLPVTNA
jgi:MFS family permease